MREAQKKRAVALHRSITFHQSVLQTLQKVEILKSDINLENAAKNSKIQERLEKDELSIGRAIDEIQQYKDKAKQISEDRKKDIEETADFIKDIVN